MSEPVVVAETKPFDPLLEDLATYLARIRAAAPLLPIRATDRSELSAGVLSVLEKLEEMYGSPES